MKTYISRHSHRPSRRYSSVRLQQGRMLYDADWNEQAEILLARQDEALTDVIGSGSPRHRGAELVQAAPGEPVRIDASTGGWLYADGVGGQVVSINGEVVFDLDEQLDLPLPEGTDLPVAGAVLYADIWQRAVVALEDPLGLLDPGLHGADTCTRTQTVAQIKWGDGTVEPEDPAANPRHGSARLTLRLRQAVEGQDPCDPCADEVAVEARVGNFLYRLEVHHVEGPPGAPTAVELKWSSENGAEEQPLPADGESFPPGYVTPDYLYELVSPASERHLGVHLPGGLTPERGRLEEVLPEISPQLRAEYTRVRRWDGTCRLEGPGDGTFTLASGVDRGLAMADDSAPDADGHVDLDNGLFVANLRQLVAELELVDGDPDRPHAFVAGDHWLVPVREAAVDPDDPTAPLVEEEGPVGIIHHYLRLGTLDAAGDLVPLDAAEHHRLHFPRLTDLVTADEVSFQKPCDTSVFEGVPPEDVSTVADALALLCDVRAEQIGYATENDECTVLAGIDNVRDALDELCALASQPQGDGGVHCRHTVGEGGEFETLEEAVEALRPSGIICVCLLPGEHFIDGLTIGRGDGGPPLRVSIHGCGSASQVVLRADGLRFVRLQRVELERFAIRSPEAAPVVTEDCVEVVWRDLEVTFYRRGSTPLFIGGADSVTLQGNRLAVLDPLQWANSRALVDGTSTDGTDFGDFFTADALDVTAVGSEAASGEALRRAVDHVVGLSRDEQDSLVRELLVRAESLFGRRSPVTEPLQTLEVTVRRRSLNATDVATALPRMVRGFFFADPSPLLAFDTIAHSITLRDNDLVGEVSFYGRAENQQDLNRSEMGVLRELIQAQDLPFVALAATAHVEDNRCGRWLLGEAMIEQIRGVLGTGGSEFPGVLGAFLLARNRTYAADNFFFGRAVRLTDNHFGASGRRLASVIGASTQHAGSHCDVNNEVHTTLDVSDHSNQQLWSILNHLVITVP